ncbi:ABC transporter permease [Cellulomonas shaoxiangyii]|uniref:Transport permease protein n=1 Tax=Cellulomonas shaoxiangyii TaxID=2566013 RepID=A0A4P7SGM5_9CELL|nr:ABC transporter permease [Cellulomonas shaoxiangyii]QCB93142.1 ABC transporter permease [Cellulomonas shaoxiangyii]TGY84801.1 ABC transporter permease [Cellulomonas shaoxiangyii]
MRAADVSGTRAAVPSAEGSMQRVFTRPRWFRGSLRDWADVWRYRELLSNLVRKELKVKYKDSVLGFFWTLVRPLLQLLVYSVAIGIFLGSGRVIPQFGVYLFTGLLAWSLFTDIIGGSTGSIVGNAGLVKKVYLPRELFPFSVVGASAVNFVLQLVVLIGAYVVTRSWPQPGDLLLVPLALAVLLVFATALGLVLAAANVYLRDVQYLVEVGLLLWFWMTPIVYDWTKVRENLSGAQEWLFHLYMANPMTNVVLAFQRALWPGGRTEEGAAFYYDGDLVTRLLVVGGVSLVLLWFAQRVFARAQGNFAQEL